ncbi:PIN domain-containing protein [Duganella sp. FT92W]|uniref:PIN domain-containing protein n=1 Tax=Pseudoduganella rivuli TaxID=2666085 RepID=A0A7X2II04_9BURK|nr:type II toxin-antitoxin system VapC family toxin [Pseudoduganella rivuli]MRV70224.1 PIN domain-containing protein [Pseudoduganella rivuli]
MRPPPRANCFDASALVKVFTDEDGSDLVRDYWDNRSPTKYTTSFCFYEALGVLKVKWMYRHQLTKQQYHDAAFKMAAWFSFNTRYAKEVDIHDALVFSKVRELSDRYSLDLSDAFQIISVKDGYYSHLVNDSQTVLVTADEGLATAARSEGLKCWYCVGEAEP